METRLNLSAWGGVYTGVKTINTCGCRRQCRFWKDRKSSIEIALLGEIAGPHRLTGLTGLNASLHQTKLTRRCITTFKRCFHIRPNDNQHNNTQHDTRCWVLLCWMGSVLGATINPIIMLRAVMLIAVMLSVIMPSVAALSQTPFP
jgi:hypothetical protein